MENYRNWSEDSKVKTSPYISITFLTVTNIQGDIYIVKFPQNEHWQDFFIYHMLYPNGLKHNILNISLL